MINKSILVLVLYIGVMVLLPFSRLAELPILILSIIGCYGLAIQWHDIKSQKSFHILLIMFSCYFGMVMFSAIDSFNFDKTIVVGFASLRFFLATLALIIYLEKKHFDWLLQSITILTVFWAADAMFQYVVGFDFFGRLSFQEGSMRRLNGVFGQHNVKLGPVLALLLPIAMLGLQKYHQLFRWLCIIMIILAIILSGTRSAWLMLIFTLITYWFYFVKQRRIQLLFFSTLTSIIIVISLWYSSPDFKQRIQRSMSIFQATEQGVDFALADRPAIWKTAFSMIQEHPINGVGAHAFRNAYPKYASTNDVWQSRNDGVGMHAHHWLLEILAETGLIGLVLVSFAIFKLFSFIKLFYHPRYSWGFIIALVCAFLPITSTFSIFASFWSICIWFIGAGLIVLSKSTGTQDE